MHCLDDMLESCSAREDGSHGSEERESGGESGVVEGGEREAELSAMAEELAEEEQAAGRGL